MVKTEKSIKKLKRFGVLLGVPILSTGIIISLIYYCSVWYVNQKILVINTSNVSGIAVLIIAIFLSTVINIGLTIYYSQSLKRVEKLVAENCLLNELIIKQGFDNRDEILDAVSKVGVKVD